MSFACCKLLFKMIEENDVSWQRWTGMMNCFAEYGIGWLKREREREKVFIWLTFQ